MSSRRSPRSPGKGSPRSSQRRSNERRSNERRSNERRSNERRSNERRSNERRRRGEELPEAEVFVVGSALAHLPMHYGQAARVIPTHDVISDLGELELAELFEQEPLSVLSVTKRERNMGERMSRAIGKRVGLVSEPMMKTNRALDIDLNKFEGTCLDGIAIFEGEVGILQELFQHERKGSTSFNSKIDIYCEMRDIILSLDPYFETKYSNLYYNWLSTAVHTSGSFIQDLLGLIPNITSEGLEQLNSRTPRNSDAAHQMMLLNRVLYEEGFGDSRLSKPDGRGHGKKSRKVKRIKTKTRKSNKRKSNRRKSNKRR
jgi:hypothetical protein